MDVENNILMISGPSQSGAGKAFVSINLAVIMARSDQKILLIDADMRKGFSHDIFNVNNDKGF